MASRTVVVLIATLLVLLACAVAISLILVLKPSSDDNGDNEDHTHDHNNKHDCTHESHENKQNSVKNPEKNVDGFRPSKYGKYRFASVSSDAGICAEIGTDIMGRKGGTAVDAVIATFICVGAVNAQSAGIGGGHFSLVYQSPREGGKKDMVALISRETAPAAATRDMFLNASSTTGGLAIAIPGEIRGYYAAWSRYGKVKWADLFHPTIRLLTEGFPVGSHMEVAARYQAKHLRNSPTLREVYVKDNGETVEEGDIIKDPLLARTLQRIAVDPFTFYNGSLAKDIVADIQDAGGIITEQDLRNYQPVFKTPTQVKLNNGGYTLYGLPPPAGGVVLQHILQILDGYNMSPDDVKDRKSRALTAHRLMEAFKFAYAKRSALGDEDYVNVQEHIKNMTSEDYARYIRTKIDDNKTFNLTHYEPAFELNIDAGTSHTSVLDQYGNAVAMSSTINFPFGSRVKGRRTGILFNNEMDDFSTPGTTNAFGVPASPSNFIEPGKRPQSSMCPSIFLTEDGIPAFIIGGSGGTTITTQTAAVTVNNLWLGFGLKEATDRPRLHHQLLPNSIAYEKTIEPNLLDDLIALGHVVRKSRSYLATVGSIRNRCNECANNKCLNEYCIEAVSDGRKGGEPDGY